MEGIDVKKKEFSTQKEHFEEKFTSRRLQNMLSKMTASGSKST